MPSGKPGTQRQRSGRARRWLIWFNGIFAAIIATLSLIDRLGPDRWWPGAFNLYLPQALWLVPGLLLVISTWKLFPSLVWLPALCTAWILGPVMGLCWSWQEAFPPGTTPLRVMTWNAKFGRQDMQALIDDIQRNSPDVVLFQDSTGIASGPVGDLFRGWQVFTYDQFIIASRLPAANAEVLRVPAGDDWMTCLRCRVRVGAETVTFYDVHFKSPRLSLNEFRTARKRPWHLPYAIQRLKDNVSSRLAEARAIKDLVSNETGPVVVAGDLNSTDSSVVSSTLREAGLHDCFAESGRGYGYTYGHLLLQRRVPWFTFSWMRIDHILVSSQLRSLRCWTGTGKASDHRPVIADLIVTSQHAME